MASSQLREGKGGGKFRGGTETRKSFQPSERLLFKKRDCFFAGIVFFPWVVVGGRGEDMKHPLHLNGAKYFSYFPVFGTTTIISYAPYPVRSSEVLGGYDFP